jgi:hypothetical protein
MERQPKQAVGSTPPWRSKILYKKKKDFRTRPPLLDRRGGLGGELFVLSAERPDKNDPSLAQTFLFVSFCFQRFAPSPLKVSPTPSKQDLGIASRWLLATQTRLQPDLSRLAHPLLLQDLPSYASLQWHLTMASNTFCTATLRFHNGRATLSGP